MSSLIISSLYTINPLHTPIFCGYYLNLIIGNYPQSPPNVQLSLKYNFPELEQCIIDVAKNLIGAPMLFEMIEAVREWLQNHPDETCGSRDASPIRSSDANVCKFFKQGNCKFGDKCKLLHPEKGHSPSMSDSATATILPKHKEKLTNAVVSKVDQKGSKQSTFLEEEVQKKSSMRSATDVISRILWDGDLPTDQFCIGYLDRFVGIIEKPFAAFSWEDIASVGPSVLSIPKHRIQYFKFKNQIVWDKRSQTDNFFGSRGGSTIDQIVQAVVDTTDQKQPTKSVTNDLEMSPKKQHYNDDKDRPTHFVCIHVCDQEVVTNIQTVQEHILTVSPQLSEGLVSPTAFHVTLCMVRLENDDHITKAKHALEKMKRQFLLLLPRSVHLLLNGVDNFKDRLVYIKVAPNAALSKLVAVLIERLQAAGVKTPGNHSEYTPHVTIVKMSRPMQRELSNARIAGQASYSKFQDKIMGKQQLQTIDLCSITGAAQDDGFFLRLHTISNSLVHLLPTFQPPLLQAVHTLCTHGKLSEREKATIVNVVTTSSSNSPNERKFEQALNLLSNTRLSSSQETSVVILRGVPGSGKSFLATHSAEYLGDPSQFAICSADEYFTKDGIYKFVPELIPEAHEYCLQKFLQSVSNKKFVIVDNTNSQMWEYQIYKYLCNILHIIVYIVEIPCPTDFIGSKFRSRNLHSIDTIAIKSTMQRWEKDETAISVSPKLAYPTGSTSKSTFSLESIVQPDTYQARELDSFPALFAVYTGIFLTTESQWLLASTYPPAFANLHADHVTLCFKPSAETLAATKVGLKTKMRVTGHEAATGVQAVRVQLLDVQCDADLPHITISTDNGVSPKTATTILSKQKVSTKQQQKSIVLEGTVGIVVRKLLETDQHLDTELQSDDAESVTKLPSVTITSKKIFQQKVAKKLWPTLLFPDEIDVSIRTGTNDITEVFLFDFDGTLFHTPCLKEGIALYKQLTGKDWPHKGWWASPESLQPPLVTYPGPAIEDFRSHLGRANSKTFILTSRIDKTREPLIKIAQHASIFSERVLMKPSDTRVPGYVYKGNAVKNLLSEFPNVTRIKFWDDKEENLKEVERVVKLVKPSVQVELLLMEVPASLEPDYLEESVLKGLQSFKSRLETNLASYRHMPSPTYVQAAQVGVRFLSQQFSRIIEFESDPNILAYPFGSFPLGRLSDVDLCLLAPPTNTPMEFADKLATQLDSCGIKFIHVGRSSRCPRLKVRINFNETGPIDYDIVFAIVKEDLVLQKLDSLSVVDLQSLLKPGDAASKAAFSGPVFLHRVKEAIHSVVPDPIFAAVVEMTVQILRVSHLKGNAYHCIRTFHIIQLLADFINSRVSASAPHFEWNADTLFKAFVISCCQLPIPKWKKLVGEFMPSQYVDKIIKVFGTIRSHVESHNFPSSATYHTLRAQVPIPQPAYTTVSVRLRSKDEVLLWKAASVVEAKLPTYIRQLLDAKIDVIPCLTTNDERTCIFCFAVPEGGSGQKTIQQIFRPFWGEVSEYRTTDSASIDLVFESLLQYEQEEVMKTVADTTVQTCASLVTKFCSSGEKEVHLSADLSSYERRLVHEAAERMGVLHNTVNKDSHPHIVLQRT